MRTPSGEAVTESICTEHHGKFCAGESRPTPSCDECVGGCIAHGQCHHQTPGPDGQTISEEMCTSHGFKFCPHTCSSADCAGGCLVHGRCVYDAPDLSPATPELCSTVGFTWCSGERPENPKFDLSIACTSEDSFLAEATMTSFCMLKTQPDPETCGQAGCHPYEEMGETKCHCTDEPSCTALQGQHMDVKCGFDAKYWGEADLIKRARKTGTCDIPGKHGGNIGQEVNHRAEKCCKDFPKTVCNPTGERFTPCGTEDDFDEDAIAHTWCDFGRKHPSPVECRASGCHTYDENGEPRCHCQDEAGCKVLGGEFHTQNCGHEILHWDEGGRSFKEAKKKGSCDGVHTSWGEPMERASRWLAQKCCKSFPKSICNPEGTVNHVCATEDDFDPDADLHGWCDFNGLPPGQEECAAKGCYPHSHDGNDHCHCGTESACSAGKTKGVFKTTKCGEEMLNWDQGPAIKKARKQGNCDGVETSWGEPLERNIHHTVSRCCRRPPASVCNPTGEIPNPCKDKEAFDPEKILGEWCDTMGRRIDPEDCKMANGHFWEHEGNSGCHCDNEDCCKVLKGKFNRQTCRKEMIQDPDLAIMMRKARKAGDCKGVRFDWGGSLAERLQHTGEVCCKESGSMCAGSSGSPGKH